MLNTDEKIKNYGGSDHNASYERHDGRRKYC